MRSRLIRQLIVMLSALALVLTAATTGPSAAAAPSAESARPARDYVDLVNPWVEADIGRYFFFQSASRPFGMVKLRPDTSTHTSWGTGYRRNENQVKGFSHLHDWRLSGVQVMPTTGESVPKLEGDKGWQSHVDHDNGEVAEPGYHKLHLDRYGIDAELTSTDRVGMHRYTYDKAGPSEILVNLGGPLGEAIMDSAHVTKTSDREIEGYVLQRGEGYGEDDADHKVKLYFDIRFDKPFDSMRGWADGKLTDDGKPVDEVAGKKPGAYVRYDHLKAGEQVQMKVGLSLTGAKGARGNLQTELPGWDFDAVKADAQGQWNRMLGRIDVSGGTPKQQEKFYTDLFHVLCGRSMVSDADGAYLDNTWGRGRIGQIPAGRDGKPKFAMYNYDALWLTQWNLNSVLGLAYPEIYSSLVKSQLQMYEDGGLLPRGPVAGNYSMVMSGSPVTSFITGAYNKGIRDFDTDLAYEAMMDAQSMGGLFDKEWFDYKGWGTGGNREYLDLGYIPNGVTYQGAGMTLEYANQDWSLAQFAGRLGKRGINATQYAKAKASSELDKEHGAGRAIDGRPLRAPTDVEWASKGEKSPWIELTWDKPRNLHKVVLSDRAAKGSNANSGKLEFSDGSTVAVKDIPDDGSGTKTVEFPARKVTSVKFTATGGTGDNVGLNEFEAWDDTDTHRYLEDRSRNWRKLYDKDTGFIRPRNADGSWRTPFDPLAPDDFAEANAWQATWFTNHDVMGLANEMGGETAYADKLNYAFTAAEKENFIGQYGEGYVSYGNQPGLEVAHLFNYVGKPWLSQYWVRQVKEKTFGSTATDDGYGHHDEDQGQMGAISALMAMGLFEVTGGGLEKPVYDITSPVFDEVTIKLDPRYNKGKQFRIVTHGNSAKNQYIQRAKLDGKPQDNAWFRHDQLADGGTLELWLGPEPNKKWGTKQLPPSESASEGRQSTYVKDIAVSGPEKLDEPYGESRFKATVQPDDATFKEVVWSVTEPDGSPTDKAEIDSHGTLTVNHRDGRVRVTAKSADSGDATASKLVDIGLDKSKLRGNAACRPDTKATASSVYSEQYPPENVFDSCKGADAPDADWASKGDLNPWVQLNWGEKIKADRITLSDRITRDDVNGGVLTFSDGSEVEVDDIPAKGPMTVDFGMKTFDWVRFQVKGGTGYNNGLLEFKVHSVPAPPDAPKEVAASPAEGGAKVRWKAPGFNGGVPVTGYLVTPYRDGKKLDPVAVGEDANEAEVKGLDTGVPYTFTVMAENMAGRGPESAYSEEVRPE
ncbi:glycoside hydrolase domain-containing protein [Streptomyces boninensis]|uniref:glycoside hydrolase domain-containing protein n=1 Tax=Streptomyces boninensis TaxID=2039455 RepID=UPI003B220095